MPTRRSFLISSAALPLVGQAFSQTSASSLPPSIAALKNRSHEAVPITVAERQHRIDRARELMAQKNIAALAMSGGTSLVYFTGINPACRNACLPGFCRRAARHISCARCLKRDA